MASLQDFIISKVRVKLLEVFLTDPEEMFYIRELTRKIDEEINAVRRELIHLQEHGMVKDEKRGNRLYYTFNKNYLFHKELMSMVAKSGGLGQAITKAAPKLGRIKFAMISGRFARHMPRAKDTVDLLMIGDLILPQLAELIREQEAKLGREINYTVMTEAELLYRKTHSDPFIGRILESSRVMIVGDEEDLVA
jgi:DNA-binding transcriptional ArsR family regulator